MPTSQISSASLAPNVAGTGPAFSAYLGTNQTLSANVYTKVQLNTERFDTNNNFDPTTNYRFTPTVEGYYQINYAAYGSSTGTISSFVNALYKNGSLYEFGVINNINTIQQSVSSSLVYMNGSTDYLELYILINGTGTLFAVASSGTTTYMSGVLVRAA